MKFVCEQCNTKYSIADQKVRRKVLKIRCKNCSHIIIVRELPAEGATDPDRSAPAPGPFPAPAPAPAPGRALERAFDDAFGKQRPRRVASSAVALHVTTTGAVSEEAIEEQEFPAEQTRLAPIPDFQQTEASGAPGMLEEEWYLAVDGNQFGPMPFSELCSRIKRGETGAEAFVWRDGFDDWLELNTVPELKPFVPRHPPPPPRSRSGLFSATIGGGLSTGLPLAGMPPLPSMRPPAPPVPPLPAATPSAPPPVYRPPPGAAAPYVRGTLPPGTPAQPLPLVATPAYDTFPTRAQDSGVGPLPIPTGASSLELSPPLAVDQGYVVVPRIARPSAPRTPLLLKITAGAGIASLLLGVGLVVYFIFIDRPHEKKQQVTQLAPPVDPPRTLAGAAPAPAPDVGTRKVSVEFQPVEVEPTHKEPARGGRAPRKVAAAPSKASGEGKKVDSEETKRLLGLYGRDVPRGGDVPTTGGRAARQVRPISGNDIMTMQRKHGTELKACYERALKRDESLAQIKAEVQVTIGDEGLVKSVRIEGVDSPDLTTCLRKSIGRWAFEPLGEQTFKFPIVFRGS